MFIQVKPIISKDIKLLCLNPYPLHKKGCPNWNHKQNCPPNTELLNQLIDITQPVFAIYNIFNLSQHVNRMRQLHPTWSQRQLYCCLYWQPKARKQLLLAIKNFLATKGNSYKIIKNPEAVGTNLTATMKNIGIILEWPPINHSYQIALAGIPI